MFRQSLILTLDNGSIEIVEHTTRESRVVMPKEELKAFMVTHNPAPAQHVRFNTDIGLKAANGCRERPCSGECSWWKG